MTRGGKRTGAGRKASDGAKPTKMYQLRLEAQQHAKLLRLGGSVWMRKQIDDAIENLKVDETEWPEFEPWAEYVSMDVSKDSDGYYKSESTDMAWQAWEMAKHGRICVGPPHFHNKA